MSNPVEKFRCFLIGLPRWVKRTLLVLSDLGVLAFSLWAAYSLRLNYLYWPETVEQKLVFAAAPVIGVATFYFRGFYRLVTRYMGQEGASRIYITIMLAVLLWALAILMTGIQGVPRSVVIVYGLFAAAFVRLSRHFAGWVLRAAPEAAPAGPDIRTRVLIYGAGDAGLQLLNGLNAGTNYVTAGFIDDDKSLWGQRVSGIKIYRPDKIGKLIERNGVKEVFLALASATHQRRRAVIRSLEDYPVVVKTLPALEDIAAGKVEVSDLRPIDVDDLLGRDPVPPDEALLSKDIRGKSVMITGAGGSIGSELARQVLRLGPRRLVLFELSEAALYEIESRLADLLAGERGKVLAPVELVAVLGSVLDTALLAQTLKSHTIETIYHAAAYKHVPIVEDNAVTGIRNNTFGTLVMAEAARDAGVERVVLISTDKAVRPTSIMGASKRLAELILQAMAADERGPTVFTMVRFGNVLDSSGSVVRRFRKQIRDGGPVTVTHPEMIRYFMSIPEAAQLVIQAGAMGNGGEVFVLDMGSPVKIDDLARTMIRLSGLEVQDDGNPHGDVAIEYVGLRQGEKLYEELLIGENTTGTKHPRIMKNTEPFLPLKKLKKELAALEQAIDAYDGDAIETVLKRTVEGYAALPPAPPPVESGESEDWPAAPRTLH